MLKQSPVAFLLDVDNTLLDNDRFGADLGARLEQSFGHAQRERYWAIYDLLRNELGYADYLGALQRFRAGLDNDPALLQMSAYLLEYPFAERLFPHALDAIAHLQTLGRTLILSDGDVVFQPLKVERSGIAEAVDWNVLIYVHKEHELDDVEARYPADHYVLVDDKLRVLTAVKRVWGARVTTVFPRQGHYAHDPEALATYPAADLAVEGIGDLLDHDLSAARYAGGREETG